MKARLYDAGMTHTADRYTVFLHYPKLVTQGILNHTGRKILGMGIKCAQDNQGRMIITNVVDWEEHQGSPSMRNGQRIQLSDMPKPCRATGPSSSRSTGTRSRLERGIPRSSMRSLIFFVQPRPSRRI